MVVSLGHMEGRHNVAEREMKNDNHIGGGLRNAGE